jgi:hypothetical protein
VGVDEENFLVIEDRAGTKRRWLVHTKLPKPEHVCGKLGRILLPVGVEFNRNENAPMASRGSGSCEIVRAAGGCPYQSCPPRVVGPLPALVNRYSHARTPANTDAFAQGSHPQQVAATRPVAACDRLKPGLS